MDEGRTRDVPEQVGGTCRDGSGGVVVPRTGVLRCVAPEHGEVLDTCGEVSTALAIPVVAPSDLARVRFASAAWATGLVG